MTSQRFIGTPWGPSGVPSVKRPAGRVAQHPLIDLQRQAGNAAVAALVQRISPTVQRTVTFDDCEALEFGIAGDHRRAMEMARTTIVKLRAYDGTSPAAVAAALQKHFHSKRKIVASMVANGLENLVSDADDVQYECHEQEDQGSTLAEALWCIPFTDVKLFKKYFSSDDTTKANTLIHELSHRYLCTFDLGYDWEPSYGTAGTFRALNNAEPYGNI